MIVRISGEDVYELDESHHAKLDELDDAVVTAVDAGDEATFHELWAQMLELVRSDGEALGEEELEGSDVILPPRDITFAEAQGEFTGDGLIPD